VDKITEILLTSPGAYEKLAVEIDCDTGIFAELNQEGSTPVIKVSSKGTKRKPLPHWEFDFDELIDALVRSKKTLLDE
jgi:hypothetical protein